MTKDPENFTGRVPSVEYDTNKRWEQGMAHHPKSVALFDLLAEIDFHLCKDYFCWKSGGDGDNGEQLMFEMDIYFEEQDAKEKT